MMLAMKRNASALLITRGGERGVEVFLAERAPQLRFFGGYLALPGGVRGPEDGEDRDGSDVPPLRQCAVRELFEETGLIRLGPPPPGIHPADVRREMLIREKERRKDPFTPWLDWMAAAPAEELQAICRIETPPFAPVRYDTVFFHVPLRDGEQPVIVEGELVDGAFWRPQDALDAWHRGELRIVPPVLILLERMVGRPLDDAFGAIAATAASYADGVLHRVRFSPGIVMAPLRTPTLPPATTTNCYVVGEERAVVIDPGSPYPDEQARLLALLDEMVAEGRQLDGIVLTHHHPDHVGGVAALSTARQLPVHAHPTTLDRLPPGFRRGRELLDGDTIDLGANPAGDGDWHLTARFTPGHDRGHLAFTDSRYGTAIVGDMLSTISTIVIDPPEGHLRTYLDSLRRLQQEPLTTLYPAHGPAVRDGRKLVGDYLEHRRARETSLLAALGPSPRPAEDLVADVYWDAPEALRPVALRSLVAGLEKLAEDGLAARADDGWRRLP